MRDNGREVGGGREFNHDAGEVLRRLGHAEPALAKGGIVNGDAAPAGLGQDDEVIEVPVQDGRALHLGQRAKLNA